MRLEIFYSEYLPKSPTTRKPPNRTQTHKVTALEIDGIIIFTIPIPFYENILSIFWQSSGSFSWGGRRGKKVWMGSQRAFTHFETLLWMLRNFAKKDWCCKGLLEQRRRNSIPGRGAEAKEATVTHSKPTVPKSLGNFRFSVSFSFCLAFIKIQLFSRKIEKSFKKRPKNSDSGKWIYDEMQSLLDASRPPKT